MVARRGQIIARQVHQLHSRGTSRGADRGIALDEVAGVQQQDIGASGLIGVLQGRHLGIAADGAMDVIGVQDDDAACHILGRSCLLRAGGDGQRQCHDQRKRKRDQLAHLFHLKLPPLLLRTRWCDLSSVYHQTRKMEGNFPKIPPPFFRIIVTYSK